MKQHGDAEQEHEESQHDENRYIAQRRDKLSQLRARGQAYPNGFKRRDLAADIHAAHGDRDKQELEDLGAGAQLAGRMMLQRDKGKVVFADLQDMSGKIQIFVRRDAIGEAAFDGSVRDLIRFAPVVDEFKALDEEIVTNSIRFRWLDVKQQLKKRLNAAGVASDWHETGS